MKMDWDEKYLRIINYFGEKKQIDKLAEEQAELQHALLCGTCEDITEEFADNVILMRQFCALHDSWRALDSSEFGGEIRFVVKKKNLSKRELLNLLIIKQANLQLALRSRDEIGIHISLGHVTTLLEIFAKREGVSSMAFAEKVDEKMIRTAKRILDLREDAKACKVGL